MTHALAARLFVWIFAAIFIVGAATTQLDAAEPESGKPNVLFIVVDDLNVDVGCYGQSIVRTPHIDRLAARGVRFDRAYAQYALCNPSRSSFLSGYEPDRTGVVEQDGRARESLPDAVFLPQLFRNNGYFTAAAGKLHHGGSNVDRPSWDEYEDDEGTEPIELAAKKARSKADDRTPGGFPLHSDGQGTQDDLNTRRIVRLLEERSRDSRAFFLALGLHKPHVQWVAPRRLFDLYPEAEMPRRDLLTWSGIPAIALQTEWPVGTKATSQQAGVAAYFACVSFTDDHVGMIMAELDRHDLWKTTIVVFFSDHGFHLGDHGLWSKKTLFEQSLRVPLVVVMPDGRNGGRTCRRTVQLLDLYPTLADLSGLPAAADLPGHSLRPLLDDPDAPWDRPAYSQVVHENVVGRSVRTERWRYTEWDEGRAGAELYDHDLDPLELVNLAAHDEYQERRRQLAQQLQKHTEQK